MSGFTNSDQILIFFKTTYARFCYTKPNSYSTVRTLSYPPNNLYIKMQSFIVVETSSILHPTSHSFSTYNLLFNFPLHGNVRHEIMMIATEIELVRFLEGSAVGRMMSTYLPWRMCPSPTVNEEHVEEALVVMSRQMSPDTVQSTYRTDSR